MEYNDEGMTELIANIVKQAVVDYDEALKRESRNRRKHPALLTKRTLYLHLFASKPVGGTLNLYGRIPRLPAYLLECERFFLLTGDMFSGMDLAVLMQDIRRRNGFKRDEKFK